MACLAAVHTEPTHSLSLTSLHFYRDAHQNKSQTGVKAIQCISILLFANKQDAESKVD